MMNNALEKLKEVLLMLENFGGYFMGWFDKVFTRERETRGKQLHHWLQVNYKPFVITGLVLLVTLWICTKCCCQRNKAVKTMKAPGRNHRMSRSSFESDPKSYFRGLRGKN
ncbi:unnamed protein product [Ilex paraguariensis]|uniref:ATP synthase F0 subunit 8 n=1 Tax=Ilex paraguariensis TaxID=185542 RepID=A0ABC8RBX5_9AQUA